MSLIESNQSEMNEEVPPTLAAKKRGRGRPRKNDIRNSPNDVLAARGAAAQTMTHPGNLKYYALCEERFNEWDKVPFGHPFRARICGEIVDEIITTGGVFRKSTGGAMTHKAAVEKTKDRMRQIGLPKIRPDPAFGENDVVFARGGAAHLYPGTIKWRELLDGYVLSYWRDMDKDGRSQKVTKDSKKGRPDYQCQIVKETITIIHSRGGKFFDQARNEVAEDVVSAKTHMRFKDLKKDLKDGKVFVSTCTAPSITKQKRDAEGQRESKQVEVIRRPNLKRSGCTSVRTVVSNRDAAKGYANEGKEWWKRKPRKSSNRKSRKFSGRKYDNSDDDCDSFDSRILESDGSDDDSQHSLHAVDQEWKDELRKQTDKRQQDLDRQERLKRRRVGVAAEKKQPKSKMKKISKTTRQAKINKKEQKRSRSPSPDPDIKLSAYELLRLERIKRNQERLAELGLAGSYRSV